MTDSHVSELLDRLVPPFDAGRADWSAVLERARPRRAPRRRLHLAVAAVVLAIGAAAPALAVSSSLRSALGFGSRPRLTATARFGLRLDGSRLFVGRGKPFVPRAHRVVTVRWHLDAPAARGRNLAVDGPRGRIALLCGPCPARGDGTVEISPRAALALFGPRATAVLTGGRSPPLRDRLVR